MMSDGITDGLKAEKNYVESRKESGLKEAIKETKGWKIPPNPREDGVDFMSCFGLGNGFVKEIDSEIMASFEKADADKENFTKAFLKHMVGDWDYNEEQRRMLAKGFLLCRVMHNFKNLLTEINIDQGEKIDIVEVDF